MLDNLRAICHHQLEKITCFDSDASEIDPACVSPGPELCFIDGEHTDRAVRRDFEFCRAVLSRNGAVMFHDANIVYRGLIAIVAELERRNENFRAFALPDCVFVIEFNELRLHDSPAVRQMLINNHAAYLRSLSLNDHFRQFSNRLPFRILRQVKGLVRGSRRFD